MHGGPINLKSAILPDASLRFASLLDADLQAADLTRADLVHARLDRANLKNAILKDAVLDHADFADAHLGRAILTGASLCHARNLTQDQIDETIGDTSTTLPAHLERPTAWIEVATPQSLSSSISYRKALIAGAAASMMAGAILLGFPRDEEYLEPPASAIKTDQVGKPPASASSDARSGSATTSNAMTHAMKEHDQNSAQSTSENVTAPSPQQGVSENSVAMLALPESTESVIGLSASLTDNPTIDSPVRVDGVLRLRGHEQAATARVEFKSSPAVLASLGSSEQGPSIALTAPAALSKAPTDNELRANSSSIETAPPLPERKPVVAPATAKSKVAIPADAKPAAPTSNSLRALPPSAETAQPAVRQTTKLKVAIPDHLKPDLKAARRPQVVQQPVQVKPNSSTADVLAGGL